MCITISSVCRFRGRLNSTIPGPSSYTTLIKEHEYNIPSFHTNQTPTPGGFCFVARTITRLVEKLSLTFIFVNAEAHVVEMKIDASTHP